MVRTIRHLRQERGLDPSARVKVSLAGQTAAVRDLVKQIGDLTQSDVTLGASAGGAATVVRAIEIRLVADRDEAEERARLERELAEARQMLSRSRDLLAKPGFAEKAPRDVVQKEKAKLKEREERLKLLEAELTKRAY